eukprot:COSAG02_NODE_10066_length_2035_cov_1.199380_2_plen_224_part_00
MLAQCNSASRLKALDDACCNDAAVCDQESGIPTACSVACGAVLLPLLSDCGITINHMFDGLDDGVYDGTATPFVTLRGTCVSISLDELLSHIRQMQADGCRLALNGVAETSVDTASATACTDAKSSCGMSVRDGLLSCADDRALPVHGAHQPLCIRTVSIFDESILSDEFCCNFIGSQFAQLVDGLHLIVTRRVAFAVSTWREIDTATEDATKSSLVILPIVV